MVQNIDARDLERLMDARADLVIIDCLDADSYRDRHIPGAINIPFADPEGFRKTVVRTIPDKNTPIVTYCYDEDCDLSPAAAALLEERLGYTHVHEFPGGLVGWRRAGNELEGEKPRPVRLA